MKGIKMENYEQKLTDAEINMIVDRIDQSKLSVLSKFLLWQFIPPIECGNATSIDSDGRVRYRYYSIRELIDQTLKEINESGIATSRSETIRLRGEDGRQIEHFLYVEFL